MSFSWDASRPEDSYSAVGKWVKAQQEKVDRAKAMLHRVRERQWNKKKKHRVPTSYQGAEWVLVHHSWLTAWPRSTTNDPYFRPTRSCLWMATASLCGVVPNWGGPLCAQLNS